MGGGAAGRRGRRRSHHTEGGDEQRQPQHPRRDEERHLPGQERGIIDGRGDVADGQRRRPPGAGAGAADGVRTANGGEESNHAARARRRSRRRKNSRKLRDVVAVRAELDGIHAAAAKLPVALGAARRHRTREAGLHGAAARIHLHLLTGLGVLQRHTTDLRQLLLARIDHRERDEVVPPAGHGKLTRKVGRLEIGDQENDGASVQDAVQVAQGAGRIGTASLRLEVKDVADEAQGVRAAFARREIMLHVIGEEEQTDFVVVADGGKGEHAGDFGGELALAELHAAEVARSAHIHHQHDRELALFGELFHVRIPANFAQARGHIPVDRAHFVAGLVLAHFLKIHASAAKDAAVLAGESGLHHGARAELQAADLLQDVFRFLHPGGGYGTGRPWKICSTMRSLVSSSASASKETMTRWRSTSSPMLLTSCGVT